MSAARVTIRDNRTKFDKLLKQPLGVYVKVGVQGDTKYKSEKGESLSLIEIAGANEFGTSRIPSRPFLRSTFDKHAADINKLTDAYYQKSIDGTDTLAGGLDKIGLWFGGVVQKAIRDWKSPPNAESTQRRKGNKKHLPPGTMVDDPLVDTGQLVQSIRHVVVE